MRKLLIVFVLVAATGWVIAGPVVSTTDCPHIVNGSPPPQPTTHWYDFLMKPLPWVYQP